MKPTITFYRIDLIEILHAFINSPIARIRMEKSSNTFLIRTARNTMQLPAESIENEQI